MASTKRLNLTTSWQKVTTAESKFCAVQPNKAGTFYIHIGSAEPTEEAAGLVFSASLEGVPNEFSCGGLPEGVSIWVRSRDDGLDATVAEY